MDGTVGGCWWYFERASEDSYSWNDTVHDEQGAGCDGQLHRCRQETGRFDSLEPDTLKAICELLA